eukprot:m51a1_g8254 putative  leucine-rich nuclear phosphoprotein (3408) ;mRNA; f:147945-159324
MSDKERQRERDEDIRLRNALEARLLEPLPRAALCAVHERLAEVHARLGDARAAARSYDAAAALIDPRRRPALAERAAQSLLLAGSTPDVADVLRWLESADRSSASAALLWARAATDQETAESRLRAAIEAAPRDARLHVALVALLTRRGDFHSVVKLYDRHRLAMRGELEWLCALRGVFSDRLGGPGIGPRFLWCSDAIARIRTRAAPAHGATTLAAERAPFEAAHAFEEDVERCSERVTPLYMMRVPLYKAWAFCARAREAPPQQRLVMLQSAWESASKAFWAEAEASTDEEWQTVAEAGRMLFRMASQNADLVEWISSTGEDKDLVSSILERTALADTNVVRLHVESLDVVASRAFWHHCVARRPELLWRWVCEIALPDCTAPPSLLGDTVQLDALALLLIAVFDLRCHEASPDDPSTIESFSPLTLAQKRLWNSVLYHYQELAKVPRSRRLARPIDLFSINAVCECFAEIKQSSESADLMSFLSAAFAELSQILSERFPGASCECSRFAEQFSTSAMAPPTQQPRPPVFQQLIKATTPLASKSIRGSAIVEDQFQKGLALAAAGDLKDALRCFQDIGTFESWLNCGKIYGHVLETRMSAGGARPEQLQELYVRAVQAYGRCRVCGELSSTQDLALREAERALAPLAPAVASTPKKPVGHWTPGSSVRKPLQLATSPERPGQEVKVEATPLRSSQAPVITRPATACKLSQLAELRKGFNSPSSSGDKSSATRKIIFGAQTPKQSDQGRDAMTPSGRPYSAGATPLTHGSPASQTTRVSVSDGWKCMSCGYVNEKSQKTCQFCLEASSKPASPPTQAAAAAPSSPSSFVFGQKSPQEEASFSFGSKQADTPSKGEQSGFVFGGSSGTSGSSSTPISSIFAKKEEPKVPEGGWKCPCCERVNAATDKSCQDCLASVAADEKPAPASTSGFVFGQAAPAVGTSAFSFGSKQSVSPSKGGQSGFVFGGSSAASGSSGTPISSIFAKKEEPKVPEGGWKCPCCERINVATDKSCQDCLVDRPKDKQPSPDTCAVASKIPSSAVPTSGFAFGQKDEAPVQGPSTFSFWSNQAESPSKGGQSGFVFGGSSGTAGASSISSIFAKKEEPQIPEGGWKCPCCETINSATVQTCSGCYVNRPKDKAVAPVKREQPQDEDYDEDEDEDEEEDDWEEEEEEEEQDDAGDEDYVPEEDEDEDEEDEEEEDEEDEEDDEEKPSRMTFAPATLPQIFGPAASSALPQIFGAPAAKAQASPPAKAQESPISIKPGNLFSVQMDQEPEMPKQTAASAAPAPFPFAFTTPVAPPPEFPFGKPVLDVKPLGEQLPPGLPVFGAPATPESKAAAGKPAPVFSFAAPAGSKTDKPEPASYAFSFTVPGSSPSSTKKEEKTPEKPAVFSASSALPCVFGSPAAPKASAVPSQDKNQTEESSKSQGSEAEIPQEKPTTPFAAGTALPTLFGLPASQPQKPSTPESPAKASVVFTASSSVPSVFGSPSAKPSAASVPKEEKPALFSVKFEEEPEVAVQDQAPKPTSAAFPFAFKMPVLTPQTAPEPLKTEEAAALPFAFGSSVPEIASPFGAAKPSGTAGTAFPFAFKAPEGSKPSDANVKLAFSFEVPADNAEPSEEEEQAEAEDTGTENEGSEEHEDRIPYSGTESEGSEEHTEEQADEADTDHKQDEAQGAAEEDQAEEAAAVAADQLEDLSEEKAEGESASPASSTAAEHDELPAEPREDAQEDTAQEADVAPEVEGAAEAPASASSTEEKEASEHEEEAEESAPQEDAAPQAKPTLFSGIMHSVFGAVFGSAPHASESEIKEDEKAESEESSSPSPKRGEAQGSDESAEDKAQPEESASLSPQQEQIQEHKEGAADKVEPEESASESPKQMEAQEDEDATKDRVQPEQPEESAEPSSPRHSEEEEHKEDVEDRAEPEMPSSEPQKLEVQEHAESPVSELKAAETAEKPASPAQFVFGAQPDTTATPPAFTFGAPESQTSASPPAFTFGASTAEQGSSAAPAFCFGNSQSTAVASPFSFAQSAKEQTAEPEADTWKCPCCEAVNDLSSQNCKDCYAARDVAKPSATIWWDQEPASDEEEEEEEDIITDSEDESETKPDDKETGIGPIDEHKPTAAEPSDDSASERVVEPAAEPVVEPTAEPVVEPAAEADVVADREPASHAEGSSEVQVPPETVLTEDAEQTTAAHAEADTWKCPCCDATNAASSQSCTECYASKVVAKPSASTRWEEQEPVSDEEEEDIITDSEDESEPETKPDDQEAGIVAADEHQPTAAEPSADFAAEPAAEVDVVADREPASHAEGSSEVQVPPEPVPTEGAEQTTAAHAEADTWKCPCCDATNAVSSQSCTECYAARVVAKPSASTRWEEQESVSDEEDIITDSEDESEAEAGKEAAAAEEHHEQEPEHTPEAEAAMDQAPASHEEPSVVAEHVAEAEQQDENLDRVSEQEELKSESPAEPVAAIPADSEGVEPLAEDDKEHTPAEAEPAADLEEGAVEAEAETAAPVSQVAAGELRQDERADEHNSGIEAETQADNALENIEAEQPKDSDQIAEPAAEEETLVEGTQEPAHVEEADMLIEEAEESSQTAHPAEPEPLDQHEQQADSAASEKEQLLEEGAAEAEHHEGESDMAAPAEAADMQIEEPAEAGSPRDDEVVADAVGEVNAEEQALDTGVAEDSVSSPVEASAEPEQVLAEEPAPQLAEVEHRAEEDVAPASHENEALEDEIAIEAPETVAAVEEPVSGEASDASKAQEQRADAAEPDSAVSNEGSTEVHEEQSLQDLIAQEMSVLSVQAPEEQAHEEQVVEEPAAEESPAPTSPSHEVALVEEPASEEMHATEQPQDSADAAQSLIESQRSEDAEQHEIESQQEAAPSGVEEGVREAEPAVVEPETVVADAHEGQEIDTVADAQPAEPVADAHEDAEEPHEEQALPEAAVPQVGDAAPEEPEEHIPAVEGEPTTVPVDEAEAVQDEVVAEVPEAVADAVTVAEETPAAEVAADTDVVSVPVEQPADSPVDQTAEHVSDHAKEASEEVVAVQDQPAEEEIASPDVPEESEHQDAAVDVPHEPEAVPEEEAHESEMPEEERDPEVDEDAIQTSPAEEHVAEVPQVAVEEMLAEEPQEVAEPEDAGKRESDGEKVANADADATEAIESATPTQPEEDVKPEIPEVQGQDQADAAPIEQAERPDEPLEAIDAEAQYQKPDESGLAAEEEAVRDGVDAHEASLEDEIQAAETTAVEDSKTESEELKQQEDAGKDGEAVEDSAEADQSHAEALDSSADTAVDQEAEQPQDAAINEHDIEAESLTAAPAEGQEGSATGEQQADHDAVPAHAEGKVATEEQAQEGISEDGPSEEDEDEDSTAPLSPQEEPVPESAGPVSTTPEITMKQKPKKQQQQQPKRGGKKKNNKKKR